MAANLIVLGAFTAFWAIIAIVIPFFIRGKNKGVIRSCLTITGVSCWLFWMVCYVSQMNPLLGPSIPKNDLMLLAREWGRPIN